MATTTAADSNTTVDTLLPLPALHLLTLPRIFHILLFCCTAFVPSERYAQCIVLKYFVSAAPSEISGQREVRSQAGFPRYRRPILPVTGTVTILTARNLANYMLTTTRV